MKTLLTTTAALSVGLMLGMNQPIHAQSPYSVPNGQGDYAPSADNTPYPQQGATPEGTTARGSPEKRRALTAQQLQNKANSGKRLTPEELQQIQDVVNEQGNVRMRSNTPAEESAPTNDPSSIMQQLQTKADSGKRLTPEELQQLQNATNQAGSNTGVVANAPTTPTGGRALLIQQLQKKINTGQRLTKEESQQLQDAMNAQ